MFVTQEFVNACNGKTFVNGWLQAADGFNWWVGRMNDAWVLVGYEAMSMTETAASMLTDPTATTDGVFVIVGQDSKKLVMNGEGFLDVL